MGRLRDFSAKCWTLPALNFCNCSQRLKQTKLCINEDAQKGNICFEIETNPWSRDAISIVRQENPVEGGVRLPEPGVRIKLNCKGFMCAGAIADPGWIQSGSRPWKYNLRWHFESEKKAIQIPNSKFQIPSDNWQGILNPFCYKYVHHELEFLSPRVSVSCSGDCVAGEIYYISLFGTTFTRTTSFI